MNRLRLPILAIGLIGLWQLLVSITGAPPYILPGPLPVGRALVAHLPMLLPHLATTIAEILLGLVIGTLLGASSALAMIVSPLLKRWMLPVLVTHDPLEALRLADRIVVLAGAPAGIAAEFDLDGQAPRDAADPNLTGRYADLLDLLLDGERA